MKQVMLINAVHKEQKRMATVDEKGKLIEFNIQMSVKDPITGNIYKGKVLKVERGLQAAFVDFGGGKDGFLPLRDVSPDYFTEQENGRTALKNSQEIIVQVVREVSGNKGALLTSYISMPGRYVVLLPNKPGSGISRKIENEEDRQKIKTLMDQIKIPDDMGCIVRTAGINRTKQEIIRDYQHLLRLWKEIQKRAKGISAPALIHQETDFGVRSLRDYLTPEIEEILVDDADTYRQMRSYLQAVAPRHAKMIKLYKEKIPIFERYQMEEQIRLIYQERVDLKSGGYIIINPTEAMISIDVNSGRGSNKRNIEETAFKTNIDACEEIARQLRLRDLGGLIVIDFIDMMDKKHNAEVEKLFKKALSVDRARIQLSRISKFGILELSRQKKQSTIQEISYMTCPYCKGSGLRPSLEYAALGAFRKIESEVVKGIYCDLRITLPHEIASYILNLKRSELLNLESAFGLSLYISGNPDMPWDNVEMQHILKESPCPAAIKETKASAADAAAETEDKSAEPKLAEHTATEKPGKKKSRRRRGRRKKTSELKQQNMLPDEIPVAINGERNVPQSTEAIIADVATPLPVLPGHPVEQLGFFITPSEHKEPEERQEIKEPPVSSDEADKNDDTV
ncbi:MAG TPA: Rne/Rng family ribonuclease [Smithellaceae bacterium]|nr:Rne/Rng family ribonuclease [Smithellaceae bacterium]